MSCSRDSSSSGDGGTVTGETTSGNYYPETFHIVIVFCIAAFGLSIGIEDVGAVTFNVIDYGAVGNDWISFQFVNGLIINGGGQINGQGSIWWNAPVCNHNT
ncbi:hypothetical protein LOK49_LG13G02139 [Camellia lanceoleosa]|uniref:Uncharacterized protein n=1 Tax=Camellia lanceoleosa TaxID=1840588 RepID=A0ACC0FKU6_9ERIC|nr:hypothetical protein LOK49_LG13G02139 [Camellia lanceoleosa]